MSQRVGGIIQIQANGVTYDAKGDADYNLGVPKRTPVVGKDGVHGYSEEPQPAYIKIKFTDKGNLDTKALMSMDDATITLGLGNGKTFVMRNAFQGGEGNVNSGEGEVDVEFYSKTAEEF